MHITAIGMNPIPVPGPSSSVCVILQRDVICQRSEGIDIQNYYIICTRKIADIMSGKITEV